MTAIQTPNVPATLRKHPDVSRTLAQADELLAELADFTVDDDASAEQAADFSVKLAKVRRSAEKLRKSYVDPLNAEVKEINGFFKPGIEALRLAETTVDQKVIAYRREIQRAIDAENERQRKLAERRAAAQTKRAEERGVPVAPIVPVAPVIPAAQKTLETDHGAFTIRKEWTFRVVDPAAVPREFLVVDEAKIRAAVRDGRREIEGVEIFVEERAAKR